MATNNKEGNPNNLEQYWSKRYLDQSTGWDLGLVSPPLRAYFDQLDLEARNLKILIPGAGNAHEAEYLFRFGFKNVYVIDISDVPLQNFKKRVPDFPCDQILLGDFFDLEDAFDIIVEQTFYCSFPPVDNIRERYTKKMHQLLKPKGRLVGLWFDIPFSGDFTKRPFGSTKPEYKELFKPYFKLKTFTEAYNSIEDRSGKELFGILEKK